MKLAEALIRRADVQKRAEQLQARIQRSAKSQEGDPPAEDPGALLEELDGVFSELDRLIAAINRSNLAVRLPDGRSLTEALAHREVLDLRLSALRAITEAATIKQERMTRSEVRFVSQLSVRDLQRQVDRLARERRELETAIQQANWLGELLET